MTLQSKILLLVLGLTMMSSTEVSSLRKTPLSVPEKTCGDPGVPENGFRIGEDLSYKATVEYFCNSGFKLTEGNRLRVCQPNWKWNGTLPTCKDINECIEYEAFDILHTTNDVQVEHGHLCHVKATCYNTIGSFHCKCWPGYHGDGKFCVPEKNIMAGALYRKKSKISAHSCGTLANTAGNSTRIRRIVGGKISSQSAWPWQAAIYYTGSRKGKYIFNGALIKPGWVLTVAHSLQMRGKTINPSRLQVILGEYNRETREGTERPSRVKRIFSHPHYSKHTLSNNIALLELEKPVRLNSHVRTVCVPKRKKDALLEKPSQYGTVAGWGSTKRIRLGERTGPLSAELRQVTVPLVPDKECKEATVYTYDTDLTFCAGFKKEPKDPCFGDVGSPLVIQHPHSGRWIAVGLFGWSEGCGRPRKYAYFTRVSKYRKWINSVVKHRQ